MIVKRQKLNQIMQALESVRNYPGVKFRYAYSKNLKMVIEEIEKSQELLTPSVEWEMLEKKRYELKIKYAKKIEGTDIPMIENNSFIMTDLGAFKAEAIKMDEENKQLIMERSQVIEHYNDLMEEDIDIPFHLIKESDVPENINAGEYHDIQFMIEADVD